MGLFGISKREAWEQLCDKTAAEYVKRGFFKGDCVQLIFQNWRIVLDEYVVSTGKSAIVYTRIRTLFIKNDAFTFRIYRKGIFSGIAKMLGANRIETGNRSIDEDYVVKGNSETKVRTLFSNERLIKLLMSQPKMDLQIKKHKSKSGDTDVLIYQVTGVIRDVERLKKLFELFLETITTLHEMGVASDCVPQAAL